jgi:hypothetical protein
MTELSYSIVKTSSGDAKFLSTSLWTTSTKTREATVLLELDHPSFISSFRGQNYNSAFIEIHVANGDYDDFDDVYFKEILSSQVLRTMSQITADQKKEEKFIFQKQLAERFTKRKWTHVYIKITQPFDPPQYIGLSGFKIIKAEENDTNELKGSTLDVPLLDNDQMDRSLDVDVNENLDLNRKERRGEIKASSSLSSQSNSYPISTSTENKVMVSDEKEKQKKEQERNKKSQNLYH